MSNVTAKQREGTAGFPLDAKTFGTFGVPARLSRPRATNKTMSSEEMKIDPARASALVSQIQGVSERIAAVAKGRSVSFL